MFNVRSALHAGALSGLLLLGFTLPAAAQAAGAGKVASAPNIEISETTKDAGQVIKGESIEYVFDVRNTGTAVLEILEARPSCGCTVASFDRTVAPGGTGKIKAVIDTNKVQTGVMTKTVTVRSNDPDQPNIFLQLKANVTSYVEILPPSVNLRTDRGQGTQESVLLRPSSGNNIQKIERVESTLPIVTAKATRVEKADPADAPTPYKAQPGDFRILLTVGPDAPLGAPQSGLLRVYTSSTKTPKIEIPLQVLVSPLVSAIPARVNFRLLVPPDNIRPLANGVIVREAPEAKSKEVGRVNKDAVLTYVEQRESWIHVQGPKGLAGWVQQRNVQREAAPADKPAGSTNVRTVSVMKKDAKDFQIDKVEVDPSLAADLVYEVKPLKEGQSYSVTLTYKGKLAKGTRSGSVVIYTNDKTEGRLEVPITITVS